MFDCVDSLLNLAAAVSLARDHGSPWPLDTQQNFPIHIAFTVYSTLLSLSKLFLLFISMSAHWRVWKNSRAAASRNRVLAFITNCTFLGYCWVTKHCRVAGSYSFSFPAFGSMIAVVIACFVAWSAAKMWMPPLFSVASIARLFVPALLPLCCLILLSYICYHICYHYMLSYMLSLYAITVCYHICYHYMLSYMLSLSCYLIRDFIFPRRREHSVM